MRHFPNEFFFRKFQVFFQKNVLRFLSLRYSADLRRSRLVNCCISTFVEGSGQSGKRAAVDTKGGCSGQGQKHCRDQGRRGPPEKQEDAQVSDTKCWMCWIIAEKLYF